MKTRMLSLIAILVLSITTVMAQAEKKEKFEVAGNCGMCEAQIEGAAKSVDGVSSAKWSIETKILEVNYDSTKVSIHKVHKAIAKAGYDTKMNKVNERAYNKLPGCCKYDRTVEEAEVKSKRLLKIARITAVGIQF